MEKQLGEMRVRNSQAATLTPLTYEGMSMGCLRWIDKVTVSRGRRAWSIFVFSIPMGNVRSIRGDTVYCEYRKALADCPLDQDCRWTDAIVVDLLIQT